MRCRTEESYERSLSQKWSGGAADTEGLPYADLAATNSSGSGCGSLGARVDRLGGADEHRADRPLNEELWRPLIRKRAENHDRTPQAVETCGVTWRPQRDLNPCRRRERPVS